MSNSESGLSNAEQSSNGTARSANSPRELLDCWPPEPCYAFHPTNAYDDGDTIEVGCDQSRRLLKALAQLSFGSSHPPNRILERTQRDLVTQLRDVGEFAVERADGVVEHRHRRVQ